MPSKQMTPREITAKPINDENRKISSSHYCHPIRNLLFPSGDIKTGKQVNQFVYFPTSSPMLDWLQKITGNSVCNCQKIIQKHRNTTEIVISARPPLKIRIKKIIEHSIKLLIHSSLSIDYYHYYINGASGEIPMVLLL